MESHLLQMRGLKLNAVLCRLVAVKVASFTDAWIETKSKRLVLSIAAVASFTDAWIETIAVGVPIIGPASRIFYRCVD